MTTASPMNTSSAPAAAAGLLQRLELLEGYLQADPQNTALLAEAFDTALRAGAHERAGFHLRHARALQADAPSWSLREAHWLLAAHRWDEASNTLSTLVPAASPDTPLGLAVRHDLAYAALRGGRIEQGLAALRVFWPPEGALTDDAGPAPPAALHALWLRLMHRAGHLQAGCDWASQAAAQGRLSPEGAGVASLMALDAADFNACERWSARALAQGARCTEALVAQGTLALARRDPAAARAHLMQALQSLPDDGRSWSALGLCELLDGRPDAAREAFARAVASMPDHIGTWHGMAWAALLRRDLPAARQAFEAALALDRNFGETHGGLAVVLALCGERPAAQAAIDRALRLDPAGLSARYAQAVLNGEAADPPALRRLARRLLPDLEG